MINTFVSELLPKIREYLKSQPVKQAWLFGSFSRGEETENSDIDILVDYDESKGVVSLFKMGAMLMDLSNIAGRRVDLVEVNGIMDFAKPSIDRDKILIYEREN
ncbi:MAG: nucleotidyltransferase domain-containing protein [Muribaculaceae bacterium]|nr:nucleotidyltransferase domain-containing protein [Muribaculaceae bacterium]